MGKIFTLSLEEQQLSEAWRRAERDLGIRVTAPFVLDHESSQYHYAALVHDFGVRDTRYKPIVHYRNGLALRLSSTVDALGVLPYGEISDAALGNGHFCVYLADIFIIYNTNYFKAFLIAHPFNWYGNESERPSWALPKSTLD
jgi:hypothetical protein